MLITAVYGVILDNNFSQGFPIGKCEIYWERFFIFLDC